MKAFSYYKVTLSLLAFFGSQTIAVVHLRQSDFDSGTYRIKTSDTYVLDENIEFQPIPAAEAARTDKPATGWFAAITVEIDNVVIDLNGKTLEASQEFVDNHVFKVYANIELDNSPFGGVLFGLVGASFPGDTSFVATNNTTVKNGTLGRSSHFGLHGNTNDNIAVHDVYVKDFEIAGIEMNGITRCKFCNIKITGNEHIIRQTPMHVAAITLINYLTQLALDGFPGAASQLASLTAYVNAHPEVFDNPTAIVPTNFYGMLFTSGFTQVTNFPMTPEECAIAAILAGGGSVKDIKIKNVEIQDIIAAPEEFVLIGSRLTNAPAFILLLIGLPIFGTPRWVDAFDSNGNFAPNPFLQAQVFAVNSQIVLNPGLTGSLPANYPAIAQSILVPNAAAFFQETLPVFGLDATGFPIKGVFGCRLDCAQKGCIKNIAICNVKGIARPGTELSALPGSQFYPDLMQQRYAGNDVWGFEFATNHGTKLTCARACNVFSKNGDSFGIHLASNDSYMHVENCDTKNISAAGDNTHSVVNPPSVAYGFIVEGDSDHIKFKKCDACRIKAPRFAIGFAAEDSEHVAMEHCRVAKVKATSNHDLSSPKEAFGFEVEGSKNTLLDHPCAQDVFIKGERHNKHSASVAAGIVVDKASEFTTIHCPKISDIYGGAGKAFDILDEGFRTKVRCPIECSC